MITLIDYGLGNIHAFVNIYKRLGIDCVVAQDPETLLRASRLILPGVGAFDWAMQRLNESGMRSLLDELVLDRQIPVLGICVGMQIMANRSDEGQLDGLGWIQGEVKHFNQQLFSSKKVLPHMGWNDVSPRDNLLFDKIPSPRFYFLHSYYYVPVDTSHVLAEADYGNLFPASIGKQNIFGVQFHPEKSHHWGVQLLQNFALL